MATGMEMLVGTVIKAMGLKPEVLIPQAETFIAELIAKVKQFDARITAIEQQNAQLIAQNAQFIALLQQAYPQASLPTSALPETQESETQNV